MTMSADRPSSRLMRTAGDARTLYVVISMAVNLLFLARSYVFMLVLDYRGLGLVTVLLSIVMLLGILQFGVLNGGYRLLLSDPEEERGRIVGFVYTFIALLGVAAVAVSLAVLPFVDKPEDGAMAILGAIGGTATLVRTWQTNQMIAAGRLACLNAINFTSATVSLGLLAFVQVDALFFCMASIVAQPVFFALAAWIMDPLGRPRQFGLGAPLAKRIMAAGFIIFAAGILLQVNIQLERWYVLSWLGVEPLGHLFLAIMAFTLIQLVPTSLDAIFLPSAVRAHSDGDFAALKKTMRRYLGLLLGHAMVAGAAIWILGEPILQLLAPRYVPDLAYVYIVAPGALLLSVSSAFALAFSVLLRFRPLLIAYGVGTVVLALAFAWFAAISTPLTLVEVSAVRSVGMALTALLVIAGWWTSTRDAPEFRLGLDARSAD